jgi:LPS export ABC transporter protein LptC
MPYLSKMWSTSMGGASPSSYCRLTALMRLTRPQSIFISVGVLLLFFGGASVLVQRSRRPTFKPIDTPGLSLESPLVPPALSLVPAGSTPLPSRSGTPTIDGGTSATQPGADSPVGSLPGSSPFTLNQFQRSEMKDGRKIWEVKAAQGQYFPLESKAMVKNAELFVYSKNGDQVTLWAEAGTLYLNGPSLDRAEVQGRVRVVRNDEVTITTEAALYDKAKNLVEIPGFVRIESAQFEISGSAMSVDLESSVVRLAKDVESVVRPAVKSDHVSAVKEAEKEVLTEGEKRR